MYYYYYYCYYYHDALVWQRPVSSGRPLNSAEGPLSWPLSTPPPLSAISRRLRPAVSQPAVPFRRTGAPPQQVIRPLLAGLSVCLRWLAQQASHQWTLQCLLDDARKEEINRNEQLSQLKLAARLSHMFSFCKQEQKRAACCCVTTSGRSRSIRHQQSDSAACPSVF